jgi:predicted phage tail protein
MDTYDIYIRLFFIAPMYFYVMSYLHLTGKVKPSTWYGYSAKGQFIVAIAFTFAVAGFWLHSLTSVGFLVFIQMYGATILIGSLLERKAKAKFLQGHTE